MSEMAPASVELVRVSKLYLRRGAEPVRALQDVTLSIPARSFVSIEGPSGCGKTTLLNLLGLLDVPTEGEVRWNGENVARLRERDRARRRLRGVGFIFQRFYLLPTLTALENVELPMRPTGLSASERRARALGLLSAVGLSGRAGAFPHQLSGGEEQRVAVARALANRPGLLLADEPTGELDSANAEAVLELVREAHASSGATVILVTHNPLVARSARRHIVMRDGRVAEDSGGA